LKISSKYAFSWFCASVFALPLFESSIFINGFLTESYEVG
jgi:hypothetical protein